MTQEYVFMTCHRVTKYFCFSASESSATLQAQSAFLLAAATGNTVELSELVSFR